MNNVITFINLFAMAISLYCLKTLIDHMNKMSDVVKEAKEVSNNLGVLRREIEAKQ